jgi:hypothetical protein
MKDLQGTAGNVPLIGTLFSSSFLIATDELAFVLQADVRDVNAALAEGAIRAEDSVGGRNRPRRHSVADVAHSAAVFAICYATNDWPMAAALALGSEAFFEAFSIAAPFDRHIEFGDARPAFLDSDVYAMAGDHRVLLHDDFAFWTGKPHLDAAAPPTLIGRLSGDSLQTAEDWSQYARLEVSPGVARAVDIVSAQWPYRGRAPRVRPWRFEPLLDREDADNALANPVLAASVNVTLAVKLALRRLDSLRA